jgi:hypothetical protein
MRAGPQLQILKPKGIQIISAGNDRIVGIIPG